MFSLIVDDPYCLEFDLYANIVIFLPTLYFFLNETLIYAKVPLNLIDTRMYVSAESDLWSFMHAWYIVKYSLCPQMDEVLSF